MFANINDDALEKNSKSITIWSKYKEDCEKTKSMLKWLPQELTHQVMVQAGPKALFRGKIVHTNEYLVNLGDTWFAKRTANQTSDILDRRIEKCDEVIKKLEKERELITQRQSLPFEQEAFGSEEHPEIIEHVSEEEDKEWRKQHRIREKEYRKKLQELKSKERTPIQTDEDLWNHLDELELQEELEDELDRLNADYDFDEEVSENEGTDDENSEVSEDDGGSASIEDLKQKPSREESSQSLSNSIAQKVVYYDCLEVESSESAKLDNANYEEKQSIKFECSDSTPSVSENKKPKQKVSFVHDTDSSDEEPLRLEIKHSPLSSTPSLGDDSGISSPADIYQVYLKSVSQNKSQSILKNKVNPNLESELEALKKTNDHYEADLPDSVSIGESSSFQSIVLTDVVEKKDFSAGKPVTQPPKKMSKFRASRMK